MEYGTLTTVENVHNTADMKYSMYIVAKIRISIYIYIYSADQYREGVPENTRSHSIKLSREVPQRVSDNQRTSFEH